MPGKGQAHSAASQGVGDGVILMARVKLQVSRCDAQVDDTFVEKTVPDVIRGGVGVRMQGVRAVSPCGGH